MMKKLVEKDIGAIRVPDPVTLGHTKQDILILEADIVRNRLVIRYIEIGVDTGIKKVKRILVAGSGTDLSQYELDNHSMRFVNTLQYQPSQTTPGTQSSETVFVFEYVENEKPVEEEHDDYKAEIDYDEMAVPNAYGGVDTVKVPKQKPSSDDFIDEIIEMKRKKPPNLNDIENDVLSEEAYQRMREFVDKN